MTDRMSDEAKGSALRVDRLVVRQIRLPLVHFFETSFSRTFARDILLIEAVSGGLSGWGEITAGENPFFNEEWTASAWPLLTNYIAPRVVGQTLESPGEVLTRTAQIRGHLMTRGGVETALTDLLSRMRSEPLFRTIGGVRAEVSCGVSIGIQDSVEQLLDKIQTELDAGYQRIKLKIKPGWDIDVIRRVRERFPLVKLSVDANSAYTLADRDHLKRLDEFYLMMIEQPLRYDDIIDHAELQRHLETPLCLDECIRSAHHAEQALAMGAARIINIKLGRVGGFAEARRVHDVCAAQGVPVWCGGMLEAGIGRAHNIALSTLSNFVLPGDVSASKRYWQRDIIVPSVEVTGKGTIQVPTGPGFGFELDREYLESLVVRSEVLQ